MEIPKLTPENWEDVRNILHSNPDVPVYFKCWMSIAIGEGETLGRKKDVALWASVLGKLMRARHIEAHNKVTGGKTWASTRPANDSASTRPGNGDGTTPRTRPSQHADSRLRLLRPSNETDDSNKKSKYSGEPVEGVITPKLPRSEGGRN